MYNIVCLMCILWCSTTRVLVINDVYGVVCYGQCKYTWYSIINEDEDQIMVCV